MDGENIFAQSQDFRLEDLAKLFGFDKELSISRVREYFAEQEIDMSRNNFEAFLDHVEAMLETIDQYPAKRNDILGNVKKLCRSVGRRDFENISIDSAIIQKTVGLLTKAKECERGDSKPASPVKSGAGSQALQQDEEVSDILQIGALINYFSVGKYKPQEHDVKKSEIRSIPEKEGLLEGSFSQLKKELSLLLEIKSLTVGGKLRGDQIDEASICVENFTPTGQFLFSCFLIEQYIESKTKTPSSPQDKEGEGKKDEGEKDRRQEVGINKFLMKRVQCLQGAESVSEIGVAIGLLQKLSSVDGLVHFDKTSIDLSKELLSQRMQNLMQPNNSKSSTPARDGDGSRLKMKEAAAAAAAAAADIQSDYETMSPNDGAAFMAGVGRQDSQSPAPAPSKDDLRKDALDRMSSIVEKLRGQSKSPSGSPSKSPSKSPSGSHDGVGDRAQVKKGGWEFTI